MSPPTTVSVLLLMTVSLDIFMVHSLLSSPLPSSSSTCVYGVTMAIHHLPSVPLNPLTPFAEQYFGLSPALWKALSQSLTLL